MAQKNVVLRWDGEGLQFHGGVPDGVQVPVDGGGKIGPSPMEQLLLAFAGCMASDIVDIMAKSRAPLTGLEVRVVGERAPEPPKRYTQIRMHVLASGVSDADAPKLERALDLSRETYCSVLHTLRPDVELAFELERS